MSARACRRGGGGIEANRTEMHTEECETEHFKILKCTDSVGWLLFSPYSALPCTLALDFSPIVSTTINRFTAEGTKEEHVI